MDISNAEDNGKSAAAVLYINEVLLKNTPNYEDFDTLYLSIVATDKDQDPIVAENTASGKFSLLYIVYLYLQINILLISVTVPIYIQDVNDVSPVFVQSTIDSLKRVSENAEEGTSIAIILATDEDSPEIYYYLE